MAQLSPEQMSKALLSHQPLLLLGQTFRQIPAATTINSYRHGRDDRFPLPSGGFNELANKVNDILARNVTQNNIYYTAFLPQT
jgi:hypothetical protein